MLEQVRAALLPYTTAATEPEPGRLDISVEASHLVDAVTVLRDLRWGYLSAITGLDLGIETGSLEILYHFCEGAGVLTLRVRAPRDNASVPSLCAVLPSAQLFEQEVAEMFGVQFDGLPDRGHLYLPDDWATGVYPLRKDTVIPARSES